MIRIRQIKVGLDEDKNDAIKKSIAHKLHINEKEIISYEINKEAIDARDKNNILYVYEVDVLINEEQKILTKIHNKDIFLKPDENYVYPDKGRQKLTKRPIIVGTGPAGLFAAYLFAELGYHPLIIERGKRVEERIKDVEHFWQTGILNEESNVQFGEGGAGTFSDGKLNTLIKDKRKLGIKVFDIFIACGAPQEIKYQHNPHIGTDKLRLVIKNMREKIIAMGGEFRYNTKLTNLIIENNCLKGIIVNEGEEIPCEVLVLALGHSARGTFKMLLDSGLDIKSKAFAMGVRIMHKQKMINESQYGLNYQKLPNASYKLTYTTSNNRGVYSFCMCPGGYVVNASSKLNHLVINGMSNYARDTLDANSAIIVTVSPKDYGDLPLDGVNFQKELEQKTYSLTNGKIPIQTWLDFKNNRKSTTLGTVTPITKGAYELANLREILPSFMIDALLEAMPNFEKKIKGFASDDALIAAIESRTSSPIRMLRDENGQSNIKGIFPCGEGAGYAGGITSSAIDGLKIAEEIIKKYHF